MCVFDYCNNKKEVDVTLFTIKGKDLQEHFSFFGEVKNDGNINYVQGKVTEPLGITEGAQADVYIGKKYYEGYLQTLKKSDNTVYDAYVSVISEKKLNGSGKVTVYGDVDKNVMLVPSSCIFTDEKGNDCVMVVTQGYCVKRKVELGKIALKGKKEIKKGVFCDEKIVINPKNIKTGDKAKEK